MASAGSAIPSQSNRPLSSEELLKMHAYWRAANYLAVGQIYLLKNPLLREPLKLEHIKPRLLGHWGTTPGLNFIYLHFNRLIKKLDLNVIYIAGPGHGGPGLVANTFWKALTANSILTSRKRKKV
jgi:xylulose-5-phosphate/fructose-6-phosphate phosphoketolase